jgi:hypothetical protein
MEKIASWFFGYPNVIGMKIRPYTEEKNCINKPC